MAGDLRLPIVGARLTIRAGTEQDLEDWYLLETDPDVKRYVGGPVTRPRDQWLAGIRGWIQRREMLHAVVAVNASGAFAGRALLSRNDPNSKERELQVLIAKTHWGERFGSEASELLIRAGFKRGAPGISAVVYPRTGRAWRSSRPLVSRALAGNRRIDGTTGTLSSGLNDLRVA
jgi:RimJ/RimL family protein N-acetyltransferase